MGDPARPRRAGRGGGRGLDLERRRDAARHPRSRDPEPVARRQRCRGAARIRPGEQGLRDGRLHAAGSQGRRELARSRHAAAAAAPGAATSRHRAMPGRCGCGGAAPTPHGAGDLRGAAREHGGRRGRRPRACRQDRVVLERSAFSTSIVWLATRDGGNRVKLDLPTDVEVDDASRLDGGQAAHGLDGRPARPSPADTLLGIRLDAFLAGGRDFTVLFEPAERRVAAGLLLERRPARAVDPRQSAAGVRGPHPVRRRLGAAGPDRPAGDRRRRHVAARCRSVGEQRRPARDRAGSADAALPDAASPRARARPCSSGRRPRSRRKGWWSRATRRSPSTASASPMSRPARPARPAMRRCISPAMAASRLPSCPTTTRRSASCGWSAAAPASSPTSGAAASSARRGTMPAAARASGCRTTTSPPSPPTWCGAA